jgi:hypothetical protein
MKKLLICIDDTDNIDSIGTGELLQDLCALLEEKGLGKGGFVTRHQLYICDEIAYTSHNSSMCCDFECSDLPELLEISKEYIEKNSAEGSDPGLCVYISGTDIPGVTEFGKRAQREVLTKEEAYRAAALYPGSVFLSEHGGTGDGIIGALSGVGLRLTGNDGRIKGKIYPRAEGEVLSVSEACGIYGLGQICDAQSGRKLGDSETLRFEGPSKAVLKDGMVTLPAEFKNGAWVPVPKKGKGDRKR